MSSNGGLRNIPPFPPEYRAAGLLLHVTSLPSPYGIGDLGPSPFSWIDRLRDAGQQWWQALPLGPTGYGNSPYQSRSSFAGNVLLISPGGLISDGLLQAGDVMFGPTRSYSCWTSNDGHASSPEFRPIISVRRDSCGAILFTTGTYIVRLVIGGV